MPGLTRARRAGAPTVSRPLTPEHLGRIVVARFLELPLRTFERRVCALEQAPRFQELLRDVVRIGNLSGQPPTTARQARSHDLLGVMQRSGDRVVWRYASPAFDREYVFEEEALARLLARDDLELIRLVSRLRLVNTRNRLTHALVRALLEVQREYVLTGDPLRRKPLSQAALSARIRASGACPVDADPSRVSRLLQGIAARLPNGEVVRLRNLCPAARDLHRHYVSQVIKQERVRMIENRTLVPMTDREIVSAVQSQFGARLLPRTVAYIRREHVPPGSGGLRDSPLRGALGGVHYKIARGICINGSPPTCGVQRQCLLAGVRERRCCSVSLSPGDGGLAGVERAVYRVFCATFGAPPRCNRMSP